MENTAIRRPSALPWATAWIMRSVRGIRCWTKNDIPEGSSVHDFRDPKMWQAEDGTYCCVVGNRPADGSGQILLYTSPDGFQWTFKSVLAANNNRFGKHAGNARISSGWTANGSF